jgi:GTPase SAR1 family protein
MVQRPVSFPCLRVHHRERMPCCVREDGRSITQSFLRATASQGRFNSLVPMDCRSACVALLVHSVIDWASFSNLPKWIDSLRTSAPEAGIVVLGNKCDLETQRTVLRDEVNQFRQTGGCVNSEGRAKTGQEIQCASEAIAGKCCDMPSPTARARASDESTTNRDRTC